MKKLFLLTTASLALYSCEKTYQCECIRIVNGEDWNPIVTNVAIEDTKKDADAACKSLNYSFGWQDYQSCGLK